MFDEKTRFRRDLRVDFLRGLALITIFVDHVPHNRWAAVTQQNFGFSDAAEMFVALAGFSAVLAYGRYFDAAQFATGWRLILQRVGIIYIYHLATLVVVAVILMILAAAFDQVQLAKLLNFEALLAGEPAAVIGAALLVNQPTYFDILPLYVFLLVLFPILYVLLSRSIMLGLAISAVPWVLVQFFPINFPTTNGHGWHFNPLAWQFLLALGMAAALKSKRGEMQASTLLVVLAAAVLLISVALRAPWTRWPLNIGMAPISLEPYGALMTKSTLGPVRLLHFVSFGYLLIVLLHPREAWLKIGAARIISDAGRNSLEVFCVGVILAVLSGALVTAVGKGAIVESWVTTVGVGVLLLFGIAIARRVRARKRALKRNARLPQAASLPSPQL